MYKLLILLAIGCVVVKAESRIRPHYVRTPLGDSIDKYTMNMLYTANAGARDKNVVLFPLGILTLLALYNEGAGVNKFLGSNDSRQASVRFQELSSQLSAINGSYLTVANKISVSNRYSLNKQFSAAARRYRCDLDTLDFSKPEEAAAAIADMTEGHIGHPVDENTFGPEVVAAFLNGIFFKGHWQVPFNTPEPKDKEFHVSRQVVPIRLRTPLYYTNSKQLGATMIELPFKEDRCRMVVVLPNDKNDLFSVLDHASEHGLLTDVFKLQMAAKDVELNMTKFSIRTKLDFNHILPKVGVYKLFEEGASDIVRDTPVKVSNTFFEAFIEVDEEGVTAGAFTDANVIPESFPPVYPGPMIYTSDRPFLFAILYDDKMILAGTYLR